MAVSRLTMTDEQRKSVALEYLKAFDNKGVTSTGGSIMDLFADDAGVLSKWGSRPGRNRSCSLHRLRRRYQSILHIRDSTDHDQHGRLRRPRDERRGEHTEGAGARGSHAGRWCDVLKCATFSSSCFGYLDPDYAGLDTAVSLVVGKWTRSVETRGVEIMQCPALADQSAMRFALFTAAIFVSANAFAQAPDAAAIYQKSCASCQQPALTRARRTAEALQQFSPDDCRAQDRPDDAAGQRGGRREEPSSCSPGAPSDRQRRFDAARATAAPAMSDPTKANWNGWGRHGHQRDTSPTRAASRTPPRLKLKWAFRFRRHRGTRAAGVVGGRLFVSSESGDIFALSPKTGCITGVHGQSGTARPSPVGLVRPRPARTAGASISLTAPRTCGVDATTGKQIWMKHIDEHPGARIPVRPHANGRGAASRLNEEGGRAGVTSSAARSAARSRRSTPAPAQQSEDLRHRRRGEKRGVTGACRREADRRRHLGGANHRRASPRPVSLDRKRLLIHRGRRRTRSSRWISDKGTVRGQPARCARSLDYGLPAKNPDNRAAGRAGPRPRFLRVADAHQEIERPGHPHHPEQVGDGLRIRSG